MYICTYNARIHKPGGGGEKSLALMSRRLPFVSNVVGLFAAMIYSLGFLGLDPGYLSRTMWHIIGAVIISCFYKSVLSVGSTVFSRLLNFLDFKPAVTLLDSAHKKRVADEIAAQPMPRQPKLAFTTDKLRWRCKNLDGVQTWEYLEDVDGEAAKAWPQTHADKLFLGLDTVSYT